MMEVRSAKKPRTHRPALARVNALLERQRKGASEWMDVIGWLPASYECELHGIVEDAFRAGVRAAGGSTRGVK